MKKIYWFIIIIRIIKIITYYVKEKDERALYFYEYENLKKK